MGRKTQVIEPKIYIGKTINGLSQYTVFADGVVPPMVAELAAKNEAINGLIVPVSALAEARKNMRTKGHILYYYASQL